MWAYTKIYYWLYHTKYFCNDQTSRIIHELAKNRREFCLCSILYSYSYILKAIQTIFCVDRSRKPSCHARDVMWSIVLLAFGFFLHIFSKYSNMNVIVLIALPLPVSVVRCLISSVVCSWNWWFLPLNQHDAFSQENLCEYLTFMTVVYYCVEANRIIGNFNPFDVMHGFVVPISNAFASPRRYNGEQRM